ncbi:hypothetical protein [Halorussus caseinilyticus]|uniref:hypothetical protein n=1 Tax=Halorussus caseinilyticus TaxID=3034025 RepID=UPI0023E8BE4E|nr:hypothetical protein [Halorussus sp. DT72]
MANKFAGEVEQMKKTRSQPGTPEIGGSQSASTVNVPTMSTVEEMATVDDLGILFDDRVEKRVLNEIKTTELPEDIEDIILDDGVLGDREELSWKWVWHVCTELLTLDCVGDEYRQEAYEAKALMAIYVTLVDDIGEQLNDKATFWELAKTAYPEAEPDWEREDINSDYAHSIRRVWTELMDRLESAPRFDEFEDPFMFNLRETVQAMEYTQMSDEYSAFMNPEEMWHFDTQGIGSFLYWTVDLMYSPSFEMDDFREFRQLVHELQHMWRLGNWITTWEEEVYEQDFSAGVFVEALNNGVIDETDIERLESGETNPERLIGRIKASGIVEQFIADWKRRRDRLHERDFEMQSLDADQMVVMMERMMRNHLATSEYR